MAITNKHGTIENAGVDWVDPTGHLVRLKLSEAEAQSRIDRGWRPATPADISLAVAVEKERAAKEAAEADGGPPVAPLAGVVDMTMADGADAVGK